MRAIPLNIVAIARMAGSYNKNVPPAAQRAPVKRDRAMRERSIPFAVLI